VAGTLDQRLCRQREEGLAGNPRGCTQGDYGGYLFWKLQLS
jgi:hypothetical protein